MTSGPAQKDDDIVKLESVPPPEDDEAYAAPTKVGEAAYRILAEGMAAFDAPPASGPVSSGPRSSGLGAALSKPRASSTPAPLEVEPSQLPKVRDEDVDVEDFVGTKLMPNIHEAASLMKPPTLGEPPPRELTAMLQAPASPSELRVLGGPPPPVTPADVVGTLPQRRVPPEIIVGVVSFLVIAVPAIVYLLLF